MNAFTLIGLTFAVVGILTAPWVAALGSGLVLASLMAAGSTSRRHTSLDHRNDR